jgi:hypothetical protein
MAMEIKGPAVKSIPEFVKKNYKARYNEWLDSLSAESKKIMANPVYSTGWYPVHEAAIEPTEKIGLLFFKSKIEAAWESGKYSAESTLKGVYRIFIKASSPQYIISRASKVFTTYYRPSKMQVVDSGEKFVITQITEFGEPNSIVEYRIGGWMEKALELSGCKDVKVFIKKSLTKGDSVTEYSIRWS